LALALSAVLFVGMGYFVVWQGHVTDRSHSAAAEAQTARVVLDYIARDIRNAIVRSSMDATTSTAESLQSDRSTDGSDNSTGGTNADLTGAQSDTTQGEDSELGSTSWKPGIRGSSNHIQIDTYLVPSILDQWNAGRDTSLALSGPVQPDLLAVAYAVDVSQHSGTTTFTGLAGAAVPHLLRGTLPTAAAIQGSQQGEAISVLGAAKSFAPHVRAIEFWYFDGTQWLTMWDSGASGGLPVAIQVLVWVDANDEAPTTPPTRLREFDPTVAGDGTQRRHLFSSIVAIPASGSAATTTNSVDGAL